MIAELLHKVEVGTTFPRKKRKRSWNELLEGRIAHEQTWAC